MMPLNPLDFLFGLLGKYRLQLAVILLAFSAFLFWSHHEFHRGVEAQQARDARALQVAQAKADKLSAELRTKASETGTQAREAQTRILTRTKTIVQRIPYEIPAARDPFLGGGFLRLYNASLGLSEGAGTAGGAEVSDPGLRSSDALQTIAGNDAACLLWKDRAERLDALYEAVRERVNGSLH